MLNNNRISQAMVFAVIQLLFDYFPVKNGLNLQFLIPTKRSQIHTGVLVVIKL